MAFLSLEDLLGTVEVIVWPNDYEKNSAYLNEESRIFIRGRASVEEEKDAKVICDEIIPFENIPRKLWISDMLCSLPIQHRRVRLLSWV